MKRLLLAIILLLGISPDTRSQDEPNTNAEQRPPPSITYFVKSDTRVSKNMIFLFDCSTSMGRNNRFQTGMAQVKAILGQPLDDGMFSLIGFQSTEEEFQIWPGLKEKDDPKPAPDGWAKLPSAHASIAANDFLNKIQCTSYTDIGSAIEKAFKLNVNKKELTIIIFSDGNNTYPTFSGKRPSEVKKHIAKLQQARVKANKDKIAIFVFGVSAEQNVVMLSAIAKAGNGTYLTADDVCKVCRKSTKDVPEVQRVHRASHIDESHPDYDDDDPFGGDDPY